MFCVDEKTAIQALDRNDRMLPLAPGRAESHGFEYKRNGTLSLFAALNTATGEVLGMTAPRHTSERFVGFLGDVVASQPEGREIHVICDNVSSHKTELVQAFLAEQQSEFAVRYDVLITTLFRTWPPVARRRPLTQDTAPRSSLRDRSPHLPSLSVPASATQRTPAYTHPVPALAASSP